ncbi:MAG: class I SAM-dependent methyltransferase [Trebonia sp.]
MLVRAFGPPLRALGTGDYEFIARLAGSTHGESMLALPAEHWATLVDHLGLARVGSVLDVGCGMGTWLPALARTKHTVIGIDPDGGSVAAARSRTARMSNVHVHQMAAERLALASSSLDAVVCITALPYLSQPDAVREMARVLRGCGKLVIGTVGSGYYAKHVVEGLRYSKPEVVSYGLDPIVVSVARTVSRREVASDSLRSWTPRAVRSLLAGNGFAVQSISRDPSPANPEWPRRYLGRPFYFTAIAVRRAGRS